MSRIKRTSKQRGILTRAAPPPDLSNWIDCFVHRDDSVDGAAVVVLPETRPSIQIFYGDTYWLREQGASRWRAVPREGLWGPRYHWAYGFAERRISVFGIGLKPAGAALLTKTAMPDLVDGVVDWRETARLLYATVLPGQSFTAWVARVTASLRHYFAGEARDAILWEEALHVLATANGGAVCGAAAAAKLSERQFRRLFHERHGVSPKSYQRALRVDRLLRQVHPTPWEHDTAVEDIGFSDQPHVIREFRALTGLTPAAYVRAKVADNDRVLRSVSAPHIAVPTHAELAQERANRAGATNPAARV